MKRAKVTITNVQVVCASCGHSHNIGEPDGFAPNVYYQQPCEKCREVMEYCPGDAEWEI